MGLGGYGNVASVVEAIERYAGREMTVLHSLIDTSGSVEDKHGLFFVGVLALQPSCELITRRWVALLREKEISYLHVKELMRWENIYAAKKHWGVEGRCAVLLEFAHVVREFLSPTYGAMGVCISIDGVAYRAMAPHLRKQLKKPSLIAFQVFLGALLTLGRYCDLPADYMATLLCDDDNDSDQVIGLLRQSKERNPEAKQRISSLCFMNDKEIPPIQLADLAAYGCFKNGLSAAHTEPLYKTIAEGNPRFHRIHLDGAKLLDMAERPEIRPIDYFVKCVTPQSHV